MAVTLTVNREEHAVEAAEDTPLLWVLRDEIKLVGTKFGCGAGLCGACTVLVAGEPQRSCITSLSDAVGKDITTIEGLQGKVADAVRQAWRELDVVQCGYCQSGQIMAAAALLAGNPEPTDADIDAAFDGNVCRCATYHRVRAGVHRAAEILGG